MFAFIAGSNYKLITRNKNWCQALQYCRTHNGDLVSIGNDTENKRAIEKGEGKSFWIGLLNDDWEWEDGSCSTFREWNTSSVSPGSTFAYTTFSNISKEIIKVTDDGHADSFCTKGKQYMLLMFHVNKMNIIFVTLDNFFKGNCSA